MPIPVQCAISKWIVHVIPSDHYQYRVHGHWSHLGIFYAKSVQRTSNFFVPLECYRYSQFAKHSTFANWMQNKNFPTIKPTIWILNYKRHFSSLTLYTLSFTSHQPTCYCNATKSDTSIRWSIQKTTLTHVPALQWHHYSYDTMHSGSNFT